jgi:hypothetical protein
MSASPNDHHLGKQVPSLPETLAEKCENHRAAQKLEFNRLFTSKDPVD